MRTTGVFIDLIVAIIIILAFAVKFYGVQTYIAQRLAGILSDELGAEVSIERVEIDLIKRVELKKLLIKDLNNDTLLYAPSVKVVLNNYSLRKQTINLGEIRLIEPRIKLAKYKGEKDLNFQFIADYFDDGKKTEKKESPPWTVNCQRVRIIRANFTMNNFNKPYSDYGVDFDHLGLKKLNVSVSGFKNVGDTNSCFIRNLSFQERSGFKLDTLNTRLKITPVSITMTPLKIVTPLTSLKSNYFSMQYSDFDDFDDFENKVRMKAHFSSSTLYFGDIAYFSSEFRGSRQELFLNGYFDGTVNNFTATNFTAAYSPRTLVYGNFHIQDVTHINQAYFDVNVKRLIASQEDLRYFQVPPYDNNSYLELPGEVVRLGDIQYSGEFKGTLNDFYTRGRLASGAGNVSTDITYLRNPENKNYKISGLITAEQFDVGKVLDNNTIGKVTGEVKMNASGWDFKNNMNMGLNADIETMTFNNYTYHNTKVDGTIKQGTFKGELAINDENIKLDYRGYINFGKKIPEYAFIAKVEKAAITKLNFGNRDESATLTFTLRTTNGRGIKPDDLRGNIDITNLFFYEKGKTYDFKDIHIAAKELPDNTKTLTLDSEIARLQVDGKFNFAELPVVFISILSKAVPSMFDNRVTEITSREVFTYRLELVDFTKVQQLFLPDMQLSRNALIDGRFDSEQNIFTFNARNITRLQYGRQYFDDLRISAKNNDDFLNTTVRAQNLQINDSIRLENFRLVTQALNNKIDSRTTWLNKTGSSGDIALEGIIESHDKFKLALQPSNIKIQDNLLGNNNTPDSLLVSNGVTGIWHTDSVAHIDIDSAGITIDGFHARNGAQSLMVKGKVSKNPDDELTAEVRNFRLEGLSNLLFGSKLSLKGEMNGDVTLYNLYVKPYFVNKVTIDSMFVGTDYIGDLTATNTYEKGSDRIVTDAKIVRNFIPNLRVQGNYYIDREQNNLDYEMNFDGTNLRFVNGFLPPDVITNFNGLADGKINLTGSPKEPQFKGKLRLHNGAVKVVMLNTSYFLENGEIQIEPDMFALNNLIIQDVKGNGGKVNGTYNHKNFKDGNFSFDLAFDKMLCLNTTEEMNELYYGKVFASGTVGISGYDDKIVMDLDITTNKNSKVTMPMYAVSDITVGDFVVFVNNDSVLQDKELDLSGVELNFDLKVTPETQINIVFDKLTGQQLTAYGNGEINMYISPKGEFTMNGEYEIADNSIFKLAMQSIINKNFIVAKGGTIKFYGDPLDAELDITAVYKLKSNVRDIMPVDIQQSYSKNYDVNVEIKMRGSLSRPDFIFDFTVPKADENVRAAVAAVKNTQEELFRQTMSLLIINKFITPANAVGSTSQSNVAANYTSELVTNQLNAFLSQVSKDVGIGVNYKPGDEVTNEEIAVALSKQILNGRLNISTNVGVSNGPTGAASTNQNQIIGDFNIEYLISPDGNLRVRGYNESNDFDITNIQQAPYTQGVGLFYQKEFENARELYTLQRFFNIFRPASKDVPLPPRKTREERKAEKEQRRKEREEQREEERKAREAMNTEGVEEQQP